MLLFDPDIVHSNHKRMQSITLRVCPLQGEIEGEQQLTVDGNIKQYLELSDLALNLITTK